MLVRRQSPTIESSAKQTSVRSGLLPVLREKIIRQPGSNILDLGSPGSGVLDFLAGTSCRAYWNTTRGALPDQLRRQKVTMDNLAMLVDSLVPQKESVALDVMMLWHYLDYVARDLIPTLLQCLIGLCRPGAWFYFMTHQGTGMPPASAPLRVSADGTIAFPCNQPDNIAPRHPTRLFSDWMPGCQMYKLHLMQNGVQENLFQYDGAAASTLERDQIEKSSTPSLVFRPA